MTRYCKHFTQSHLLYSSNSIEMSKMDFTISKSIGEIGEGPWNALTAGRAFQSYNWYRFAEAAMWPDSHPIYVLLQRDSGIFAGASFWRISNEPLPFGGVVGRALTAFIHRWPLLVCRSPFSGSAGWIISSSESQDNVLKEITHLGRQLRHQEKASLLLFDGLDAKTAHTWPRAISYSYGTPGMILNTKAESFEEYVQSMPKKYRQAIMHNLRRIEDRGITVVRHRTLSAEDFYAAERLYRMVEARKGSERNPWVRPMLENLQLGNGTWLAAHNAADELVGCGTVFEDNGTQLAAHLGLNETTQYIYFALLYEGIRLGLEHHLHSFYWGTGTYEVKKHMGFVPVENDSVAIVL